MRNARIIAAATLPSRLRAPLGVFGLLAMVACGNEPAAPGLDEEPQPRLIIGTVHAPGMTTFTGLTARVSWGPLSGTSAVNADGSFAVPILGEVAGFGQLTIEPDADAGVNPAWVLLTPGDLDQQGRLVLLPARWTLDAGTHAGTVIDIRPDLATDTRVLPGYWGSFFPFRQEGFLQTVLDNTQWTGAFSTWPEGALPIPLALDRPGSDQALTAADSAAVWGHVEAMEDAFGRDLFRPAPVSEVVILGGVRRADGALLLQLDSTLASRGLGNVDNADGRTWTLTADASTWSGGPVQRVGFISEDITGARIAFRDAGLLSDRGVVVHELMHILGAGHGCSWPSVQTYCDSLRTDLPTAHDVAYLEVLEAARALEKDVGTRWGLLSAVVGARVVTLGHPPIPAPALVYGPSN